MPSWDLWTIAADVLEARGTHGSLPIVDLVNAIAAGVDVATIW